MADDGQPQGLPAWRHVTAQIEQAAAAAGIGVQGGNHALHFSPQPANNISNGTWAVKPA